MFFCTLSDHLIIVLAYVDNIISGSDNEFITHIIDVLNHKFPLKYLGDLNFFPWS